MLFLPYYFIIPHYDNIQYFWMMVASVDLVVTMSFGCVQIAAFELSGEHSFSGSLVLSVTFVYCGQTVGWIRMPLGMEVGFDAGHTVLDGDLAPQEKGHSPLPISGKCLLWPNGCMDQDAIWYGGRPRPMPHCVR